MQPQGVTSGGSRVPTTQREVEANEWTQYFGSIALNRVGVLAAVEVVHGQAGDAPCPGDASFASDAGDCAWRLLRKVSYDVDKDVLEFAVSTHLDGGPPLRYFISAPRAVSVEESGDTRVIRVHDASGTCTMIRLLDALLPRAEDAPSETLERGAPSRSSGADGGHV
jgi:hypothetical protein